MAQIKQNKNQNYLKKAYLKAYEKSIGITFFHRLMGKGLTPSQAQLVLRRKYPEIT